MKISFLSTLILFAILTGCNLRNKTGVDRQNPVYQTWKGVFEDSLIDHFPNYLDTTIISCNSSYRNTPQDILYLTVVKYLSSQEKEIIKDLVRSPDSCLIKIYLNRNTYGFDKAGLGECDSYIPIPNPGLVFYEERDTPSDLEYYVLETNNKAFINHELYLRFYLPDKWKNGMTRGIGISNEKNLIFYWLVLW